jgi:predicted N-acetyltransferase YhbS
MAQQPADHAKSAALAREKVRVGRTTHVVGDFQAARSFELHDVVIACDREA